MSKFEKFLYFISLVVFYFGIAVINGLIFVVTNEYLGFGWAIFLTLLSLAFIYTLQDIDE